MRGLDPDAQAKITGENVFQYLDKEQQQAYQWILNQAQTKYGKMPYAQAVQSALTDFHNQSGGGTYIDKGENAKGAIVIEKNGKFMVVPAMASTGGIGRREGKYYADDALAAIESEQTKPIAVFNTRSEADAFLSGGSTARSGMDTTLQPGTAKQPVATQPTVMPPDAKQASDGNWYRPDPNRPGKYLQVNQATGRPAKGQTFKTKEEVRESYRNGRLSRDEATNILRNQFGGR